MPDPVQALVHDHRELNELLLAVREALARLERGQSKLDDELHEIRDGVEGFREALLEHFAREQEGLLPFVLARVPSTGSEIDRLIAEHDRIAETITLLVKNVNAIDASKDTFEDLRSFRASLARFEELYASHSKAELGFLASVSASLAGDEAAAAQLRSLLDEA